MSNFTFGLLLGLVLALIPGLCWMISNPPEGFLYLIVDVALIVVVYVGSQLNVKLIDKAPWG
jgi:hypothetical protein